MENWERTMYSEHMVGLFSSGYLPPLRKWSISSLAHLARRYCANRLRYCSLFSSVTSISSPCSTSGTICRYKCPCGGVHVHECIDVGVWHKVENKVTELVFAGHVPSAVYIAGSCNSYCNNESSTTEQIQTAWVRDWITAACRVRLILYSDWLFFKCLYSK